MTATVSKEQLHIMQHAIGNKPKSQSFRNYYATDGFESIDQLVKAGLMRKGRKIPGGMQYYHVTDAGFDFLGLNY